MYTYINNGKNDILKLLIVVSDFDFKNNLEK